jgi:hypothetical protein
MAETKTGVTPTISSVIVELVFRCVMSVPQ